MKLPFHILVEKAKTTPSILLVSVFSSQNTYAFIFYKSQNVLNQTFDCI